MYLFFFSLFNCSAIRAPFSDEEKKKERERKKEDSTSKGLNQRSKDVTQVQQQRPKSPTVTLTWHACKYKVHKLHRDTSFDGTKPDRRTNESPIQRIQSLLFLFTSA